jgi:hypothetical protein
MVAAFALVLLCIAMTPLFTPQFWEHQYPKVVVGLGLVTAGCFAFFANAWHPLQQAAHEYLSFMALVGSLNVISGGIKIRVKGEATPFVNAMFLLIRPWIKMNHYRVSGLLIIFFIFVVSIVGCSLKPVGDPPLFLGFLCGVPFF